MKTLAEYVARNEAYFSSRNARVRSSILRKAENGHAVLRRDFDGVPHVALDYGPGKCSSTFVRA